MSFVRSGAVGGPGTGAGLNFQVDFAVLHALESISQALENPLLDLQISMEPRVVTSDGTLTCWDARLSHPERVTEAKLRPRSVDVVGWLNRVEIGTQQDASREFELFYGRGASPLLSAIECLCRIASEADGNFSRFKALVDLERNSDIDAVLKRLKTEPHLSLLRLRVTPIDPQRLERDIRFRMRLLVGESAQQRLYNFLSTKLHKGIAQRATYHVRDLINEANADHIEFFSPPTCRPQNLVPVVSSAIYILQHCEIGLPVEVLAAGIDCTIAEIDDSLSKHNGLGGLTKDEGCWTVGPIRPALVHNNGLRLIGEGSSSVVGVYPHE